MTILSYVHLKSADYPQHDVVSVGYRFVEGKVEVQIARCHWPDRWSREVAHNICEGRMKKYGPIHTYLPEEVEAYEIEDLLSEDFHPDHGVMIPHTSFNLESADTNG